MFISLRLFQVEKPSPQNKETPEVAPIDPIYGFNYLYFPHRDYSLSSTLDYFQRCYFRLDTELRTFSNKKVFVLSDYINKPGSVFLHSTSNIASFLERSIKYSRFARLSEVCKLVFLRIELFSSVSPLDRDIEFSVQSISDMSALIIIKTRQNLDNSLNQDLLYKLIARCITKSVPGIF